MLSKREARKQRFYSRPMRKGELEALLYKRLSQAAHEPALNSLQQAFQRAVTR